MRRFLVFFATLGALAVPAGALGMSTAPGDGTLVVKNGSAPKGTAVVTLVIRGAAIGQVTGYGKILISDPRPGDDFAPEVTGADFQKSKGEEGTLWGGGGGFRFRVVGGGYYKITIWGSGVDLVASGHGTAFLTGSAEAPARDGVYSLNGSDFKSLPALTTRQMTIGS
jgi:hypothetical protein